MEAFCDGSVSKQVVFASLINVSLTRMFKAMSGREMYGIFYSTNRVVKP
jgi:hypothetical protein